MFTANANRVTMGGQFAPNGQGVVTDGGYRLTGSWNFGSGTAHSAYIAAGFIPMADGVANAAAGFPMWIALNQTDVAYVWTYLAAFITLGLSLSDASVRARSVVPFTRLSSTARL